MDISTAISQFEIGSDPQLADPFDIVNVMNVSSLRFVELSDSFEESLVPITISAWQRTFLEMSLETIKQSCGEPSDPHSPVFAFTYIARSLMPRRQGPQFMNVLSAYMLWHQIRDSFEPTTRKPFDQYFKKLHPAAMAIYRDSVQSVTARIETAWHAGATDTFIRSMNYLHCLLHIPIASLDGTIADSVVKSLRRIVPIEASFFAAVSIERQNYFRVLKRAIDVLKGTSLYNLNENSIRWQDLISTSISNVRKNFELLEDLVGKERDTKSVVGLAESSTTRMNLIVKTVDQMHCIEYSRSFRPTVSNDFDVVNIFLNETSLIGTVWLDIYLLACAGVAWTEMISGGHTQLTITCPIESDCSSYMQLYNSIGANPLSIKTRLHLLWPFLKRIPQSETMHRLRSQINDAERRLCVGLEQYPPIRLESLHKLGEAVLRAWSDAATFPAGTLYVVLNHIRNTLDEQSVEEIVVSLRQQIGLNQNDLLRQIRWTALRDPFMKLSTAAGDRATSADALEYYRKYGYMEPESFSASGTPIGDRSIMEASSSTKRNREMQSIESKIKPYNIHKAYRALKEAIVDWKHYENLICHEATTLVGEINRVFSLHEENLARVIEGLMPAKTLDYMVGRRVILAITSPLDRRATLARKIGYLDQSKKPDTDSLKRYLLVLDLRDSDYRDPFGSRKIYEEEKVWLEEYRSPAR